MALPSDDKNTNLQVNKPKMKVVRNVEGCRSISES